MLHVSTPYDLASIQENYNNAVTISNKYPEFVVVLQMLAKYINGALSGLTLTFYLELLRSWVRFFGKALYHKP